MLAPDVAMRIRLPRVDVSLPRLHQNAAKSSAKIFVTVRNIVCCALLVVAVHVRTRLTRVNVTIARMDQTTAIRLAKMSFVVCNHFCCGLLVADVPMRAPCHVWM